MNDAPAFAGPRLKLLGVSGSLRRQAFSTGVLERMAEAVANRADFDFAAIGELPHFDQDLYRDPLPSPVVRLRGQVGAAHGVVISSPEYNHGIPGVLKNALDWASRPHNGSPFRDKPVLVISSSLAFTGGVRAHHQLRETLAAMLARPVNTPEIVIGEVGSKIRDGRFEDGAAIAFALQGFDALFEEIGQQAPDENACLRA